MVPALPLTVLLAVLSVAVPLTVEPGTPILIVLWSLAVLSALWTVATIPAVERRFWRTVAVRVAQAGGEPSFDDKAKLRGAASWLLANFEETRELLEAALERGYWWEPDDRTSLMSGWTDRAEVVSVQGYSDEHRDIRTAVRLADQALDRCKSDWRAAASVEPWPDDEPVEIETPELGDSDRDVVRRTIEAATLAEADLERIQK